MQNTYTMRLKKCTLLLSILMFFLPSYLLAEAPKNLAVFYELTGKDAEARYNKVVEEGLKEIGFNLADPHHRVNDQYKAKYGSTTLDILSFVPTVNDNKVMPLFNIDPRLAGFSPFNMLIHKSLQEENTHVGHLTAEAILDILGIEDKEVSEKFIASFKPLDELLDKEFGKRTYKTYNKLSEDRMLNFEYEFERPEDMDDFIDEFQNEFEMSFINKKYLIAGFHNFLDTDEGEEVLKDYDLFWAYSLCHLEYSYNMFDNEGARPDAGLYAPCTMYMYVRKGTNKLVVGMPKLINIIDTLGVKEASRVALVNKLDGEIPEILTAFGMKAVENVNPLKETPKAKFSTAAIGLALAKSSEKILEPKVEKVETKEVPPKKETSIATTTTIKTVDRTEVVVEEKKVKEVETEAKKSEAKKVDQTIEANGKVINITIPKPPKVPTVINVTTNGTANSSSLDRSIKFSKRIPPNYISSAERYGKDGKGASLSNSEKMVGDVSKGRISAYLRADLLDVKTASDKLKKAGFEVIIEAPLDKKKTLVSIVFTSAELKKMASKANRGYMGTLRLLIDPQNKQISITNPLYMAKAFMQDEFSDEIPKKILTALNAEFKGLRNSMDKLKFQLLPKYQFMNGMPYYQDMEVVARGADLLEKLTKKKNKKKVAFQLQLENGSVLIGVKLSKRTAKFTKKIGTNNAGMLPYPILIENGEAKILEPKYYLALMYPQLTMEEFMTIATIPGAIVKDCGKVFK